MMKEMLSDLERTVSPYTCWVVAFDECENRVVGYMPLYETHDVASAMCDRMNQMQNFWDRKDGVSLFSGSPVVWQWFDTEDPGWELFKPADSGLPVYGVTLYDAHGYARRLLVRAKDRLLARRIAACYLAQFLHVVAKSYDEPCLCYTGKGGITTNGIYWFGGPGKAPRESPV